MRCHEAQSRLNESARIDREQDRELLLHLKQCAACARIAETSDELRQAFAEATVHDEADGLSWAEQQRQVEAVAALTRTNQPKEMSFMSRLKKRLKQRPRLTLGLAAAALVLVAGTVIPLKFDQTVGFEVAVAGVDRDLALNQEKLDRMLEQLGLQDVHINITGCEATCNLVVSELDSENDANMIRLAFEEIGKNNVLVELKEVHLDVSRSAFEHAVEVVWIGVGKDEEHVGEFELQQIVTERLGDHFESAKSIFFTDEEGNSVEITGSGPDGADNEFTWVSDGEGSVSDEHQVFISMAAGEGEHVQLGEHELHFTTDNDGRMYCGLINPDEDIVDGRLTDEARAALEAEGYTVEEINSGDGSLVIRLSKGDAGNEQVMELRIGLDDDESAAKETELPEGYELSQNYPNPFNPTTRIAYSLPQAEHVTIEVFNINGQRIKTLVDEMMPAGDHTVEWNGTNETGNRVASGVYLYRLSAGGISQSKKMTLVK